MKVIFKTDRGKLRDHNEDNGAVFVKKNRVLAMIADGMGGHNAGEEASALAVKTIEEAWERYEESDLVEDGKWLEETVYLANQKIYNYASTHPECKGMGTTLVVAFCRPTSITIANVGDSRGYLITDQETIKQITEDHSLVNELVKAGQLSEEDAVHHPRKNVLMRALGTDEETKVDVYSYDWDQDHSLLLCSDGLSNLVSPEELVATISTVGSLEEKAETLIKKANDAGGHDNISVTLVQNDGGDAL